VLHLGGGKLAAAGWSPERVFARRVEALRRISAFAKGGPVRICVENMCNEASGVRTAVDIIRYIEAVGAENLGICLDTGHANITPVDSAEFALAAGPHLHALHIADNLGKNDDHMLPYSRGTVKWPPVLRALRAVKYGGLFNFEVPGENRCPAPVRLAKLDYALKLANWMIEHDGLD
jgi:sugar phosphate isomerase/epimerase